MTRSNRLAISRIALVVIVVVILAVAGGAAYFVTLSTSSSTTTSSAVSSSSSSTSQLSSSSTPVASSSTLSSHTSAPSSSMSASSTSFSATSSTSSCPSTSSSSISLAGAPVAITYLYPAPAIQLAPVAVAAELGFFTQYGLSVNYVQASSGTIAPSVESGSTQIATLGAGESLDAVTGGASLVFIAMPSPYGSAQYMMTSPTITTPQQLIGQSVGVTGAVGSLSYSTSVAILRSLGLNASQVKFVFFKNSNLVLTALLSGSINVATMSPPRNIVAAANGFKQIGPVSTDAGFVSPDFMITTASYYAANPDVVQNFLEAYLAGYRALWVTMNYEAGTTTSTSGVNTTAVMATLTSFLGFNTTLTVQSLKIYQSDKLLAPTMVPVNSSISFATAFQAERNPAILTTNFTSASQWGIINQLNSKCGFVYNLWGGSPPPAPT